MAIKSKKAMAMNTIVLFVIALVVLFVVLWIFKDQIGRAVSSYTQISTETGETAEGIRCETILKDKSCQPKPKCPEGTRLVSPPTGKSWVDCTEKSGKPLCCEEVI
jgi:hypothetical protein